MKLKHVLLLVTGLFVFNSFALAQANLAFDKVVELKTQTNIESVVVNELIPMTQERLSAAPPSNDDCTNATPLTVGAACINGTTVGSTVQAGENFSCNGTPSQSVWYSFVATSTQMYITVNLTTTSGCYLGSTVFRGSCLPSTVLACEDIAGGPATNLHNLIGLTIGATYFVQVVYNTGGPCGNNSSAGASFCISANASVVCNTCSNPCGPACGFASTPTVGQVTSTCPQYQLQPPLTVGQSGTFCYTFTASNPTVTLGMIANTSGCTSGTVTGVTWTLQTSTCGSILQSGTLANTSMSGLTVGQTYTYCYTPTSACTRLAQYPYFVGAVPLPITLLSFTAIAEKNIVELNWVTGSEENNEWFEIERSGNGETFESVHRVPGAGTTSEIRSYFDVDDSPLIGINYYRLKQTDFDGKNSYSPIVAAKVNDQDIIALSPNPANDKVNLKFISEKAGDFELSIMDAKGHIMYAEKTHFNKGLNRINRDISSLSAGLYLIRINNPGSSYYKKLIIY